VRRLRKTELQAYIPPLTFTLADDEIEEYFRVIGAMLDLLEPFATALSAPIDNVHATRNPGRRPTQHEDPYNALVRWCRVTTDFSGGLSGKRLALKDNMAIAGIPLTCGSGVLQGYVPEADAIVVERLLRAGAEIVAVTNMDSFAFSGGGDTSFYGPILNPHDPSRTASGSSGGSAAALYYDDIDISFGTDQGGSIRLPASWCGVLGLKPTFGLVPYTGIVGIDLTYDHVGPLALSVEDIAAALEVVAGPDSRDPRQRDITREDYVTSISEAPSDLRGMKIGVLAEGIDPEIGTDDAVINVTQSVVEKFEELGADIRNVSIPEHLESRGLAFACFVEGMTATLEGFGNGYHWSGRYSEDLALSLGRGIRTLGDELPPQVKAVAVLGRFLRERYFGTFYAKAQNLRGGLRSAYDTALAELDCLIMPTSPELPHPLVSDSTISDRVLNGWSMSGNTAVFDMTGHPALSIPAGEVDGLPVGIQLVGKTLADATLLKLAQTYESSHGWCHGRLAADHPVLPTLD
jgi:amidase